MKFTQFKKHYKAKEELGELSPYEKECADYIAKNISAHHPSERGLYIWQVCHEHFGIEDHKKIARHLGLRNAIIQKRKKT